MKKAIVVCTTPQCSPFLQNFRYSVRDYTKYPILTISDYSYELGKMKYVMDNTNIDEFLLLHDSVEIKDYHIFDLALDTYEGKSVSLAHSPAPIGCYLGKYRREILAQMEIPVIKSKKESVDQEVTFNKAYAELDFVHAISPLENSTRFEEKFGRLNMILENEYLIKYKSTWEYSQL